MCSVAVAGCCSCIVVWTIRRVESGSHPMHACSTQFNCSGSRASVSLHPSFMFMASHCSSMPSIHAL